MATQILPNNAAEQHGAAPQHIKGMTSPPQGPGVPVWTCSQAWRAHWEQTRAIGSAPTGLGINSSFWPFCIVAMAILPLCCAHHPPPHWPWCSPWCPHLHCKLLPGETGFQPVFKAVRFILQSRRDVENCLRRLGNVKPGACEEEC